MDVAFVKLAGRHVDEGERPQSIVRTVEVAHLPVLEANMITAVFQRHGGWLRSRCQISERIDRRGKVVCRRIEEDVRRDIARAFRSRTDHEFERAALRSRIHLANAGLDAMNGKVGFLALPFELVREPQPETQMLARDQLRELKHRTGESLGELKAGDVRVETGLHAAGGVSNSRPMELEKFGACDGHTLAAWSNRAATSTMSC